MVHHRRIMVAALHVGEHAVDVAISKFGAALQRRGHVLQERVTVGNAQWPGGAENGVHLFVREPDWGHGQPSYAGGRFAATQKGARSYVARRNKVAWKVPRLRDRA
jgi:hypothetical protein